MALVQPVATTRNGRERTVMISVGYYYLLKRRDRQVLGLADFTGRWSRLGVLLPDWGDDRVRFDGRTGLCITKAA